MNQIRAIQALNKKEIENGISPNASWHVDYRDTAYIYFGGLPYEMSEGDVITIFSQFGEPVFLKLVRDKETGKSKGFGWLKYEDQRSTDLAVDNLGGAEISGRLVRVDHARYQARDDEDQDEFRVGWEDVMKREGKVVEEESEEDEQVVRKPLLKEEVELRALMDGHDDDDPMKAYLIDEKKREVEEAKRRAEKKEKRKEHKHQSHRSRRDRSEEDRHRRSRRDRSREDKDHKSRDRDRSRDRRRHRDGSAGRDKREDRRSRNDERGDRERRVKRERDQDGDRERRRTHRGDDERPRRRSRTRSPRP